MSHMGTVTHKHLAKTVKRVVEGRHTLARALLDRSRPITEVQAKRIIKLIKFGFPGRKPRKQIDKKGNPRPTDMDLASFLVELTKKPTIVQLPAYKARLPRRISADEEHLSEKRYGQLLALTSHQSLLSFGVRIKDASIMKRNENEEDILGALRTFLIVDYTGEIYGGLKGLTWKFRDHEIGFRDRYELSTDVTHRGYQYFVSRGRRESFGSQAHLLAKHFMMRLDDEVAHYRKLLRQLGNYAPEDTGDVAEVEAKGEIKNIMVPKFTMTIEGLTFKGSYPEVNASVEGYKAVTAHIDYLDNTLRPLVQFYVRANEFAFYQYGLQTNFVSNWIRGYEWEHFPTGDAYRQCARLALAPNFVIRYDVDQVSKAVAA